MSVVSRQEESGLIACAARGEVSFGAAAIIQTPMLIPYFSSRVPEVEKPFRASEQFIDGPILISAYDVKHKLLSPPYEFGSALFLDSGGYEAGRVPHPSCVGEHPPAPRAWGGEEHAESVVRGCPHKTNAGSLYADA